MNDNDVKMDNAKLEYDKLIDDLKKYINDQNIKMNEIQLKAEEGKAEFDKVVIQVTNEFNVTRNNAEAKGSQAKADVQSLFDMTKTWANDFGKDTGSCSIRGLLGHQQADQGEQAQDGQEGHCRVEVAGRCIQA